MKSVKLPYKIDDKGRMGLHELRRLQSIAIRVSYNEHFDGNSDVRSITNKIKAYNLKLPSTFVLYGIREGKSIYDADKQKKDELKERLESEKIKLKEKLQGMKKKKSEGRFQNYQKTLKKLVEVSKRLNSIDDERIIFGGKKNFSDRCKNNISHDEFASKRLSNLTITGETRTHGNRHCRLDMENRTLTIKVNKNSDLIVLHLPKNLKNLESELKRLSDECMECKNKFAVEISDSYVIFSYEEFKKGSYQKHFNRILAFDDNPNYIGISVTDWNNKNNLKPSKIIFKEVIDKSCLIGGKRSIKKNGKFGKFIPNASKDKIKYETSIIAKHIINLTRHFKCSAIVKEDLNITSSNKGKGKTFNRLCNNNWNRAQFNSNLKKRCIENDIDLIEVMCMNSSKLGNVLYGTDDGSVPDMIASSIELARRSFHYHKTIDKKSGKQSFYFNKNEKLYPEWDDLKNGLNRWKKEALQSSNREEFFKSLIGNYRVNLREIPDLIVRTSFNNSKSKTFHYCFS